jgi:hypothetical protein
MRLGVFGQRLVSMSKRGVSTVLAQILATFASMLSALSASMSPTLTVVAPAQREHSEAADVALPRPILDPLYPFHLGKVHREFWQGGGKCKGQ